MASAKIRINPERTEAEFITPEGEVYGDSLPENADGILTVLGDVDEDSVVYVGVCGSYDGLKDNTIYKLVEVATVLEENVLIEDSEEEDEQEESGT